MVRMRGMARIIIHRMVNSRDPERTRARILAAATEEFARYGLGGARVDRIATRAGANKRMLYYYFRDKDNLFLAALEARYAHIRAAERALDLEHLEPREALRRLVEFTWRYFLDHPEFLTLLNSENLHKGRHVRRSRRVPQMHSRWWKRCATSCSAASATACSARASTRCSSTSRSRAKAISTSATATRWRRSSSAT